MCAHASKCTSSSVYELLYESACTKTNNSYLNCYVHTKCKDRIIYLRL